MPRFAAPYVRHFAGILDKVGLMDGFALVPVEVRPRAVVRAMADWLEQQGIMVYVVDPLDDDAWAALRDTLLSLSTTPRSLVVVVGTGEATPGVRKGLTYLNHRRDSVAKHLGCPLIWCGPPEFLNLTGEEAPDFWSVREIPQRIDVQPDASGIDVSMPRIPEAITPPEEIRPLYEAATAQGDRPNTARLGLRLARALVARGEVDEAARLADEARVVFEAMPSGRGEKDEAECKEVLGDVALARGNVQEARALYGEAKEIGEQLRDARLLARAYHRLGMAAQEERNLDAAEAYYVTALGHMDKLGDEHNRARAYDDLAKIAWDQRNLDAARAYTAKALTIFETTGDRHSAAVSYIRLGGIAQARADVDAAEEAYREALDTFKKLHDEGNATNVYRLLGQAAAEKKDLVSAMGYYLKALDWLEPHAGATGAAQQVYQRLGELAALMGNPGEAASWRRKAAVMARGSAFERLRRRIPVRVVLVALGVLVVGCLAVWAFLRPDPVRVHGGGTGVDGFLVHIERDVESCSRTSIKRSDHTSVLGFRSLQRRECEIALVSVHPQAIVDREVRGKIYFDHQTLIAVMLATDRVDIIVNAANPKRQENHSVTELQDLLFESPSGHWAQDAGEPLAVDEKDVAIPGGEDHSGTTLFVTDTLKPFNDWKFRGFSHIDDFAQDVKRVAQVPRALGVVPHAFTQRNAGVVEIVVVDAHGQPVVLRRGLWAVAELKEDGSVAQPACRVLRCMLGEEIQTSLAGLGIERISPELASSQRAAFGLDGSCKLSPGLRPHGSGSQPVLIQAPDIPADFKGPPEPRFLRQ